MTEAINRVQDDELQDLAVLLATVKNLNKPLREKWIDYGTGLAEGYKLARRRDQTAEEVQACRA
jgi:hypothetical protein